MAVCDKEESGEDGDKVDASRRNKTPFMWLVLLGGRGRPVLGSRGSKWLSAVERSLGWPGVSIRRNFLGFLSSSEEEKEAALSSTETGVWEVCVNAGSAPLAVFSSVEEGEVLRPARFSKRVKRAVLPAPEGPASRIDGREEEEEEEPDSSPWRYWWRITGTSKTIRRPVMMTVLLGWREAMSRSLTSSLMCSVEYEEVLDDAPAAAVVATTVAVVAMVSIVVDIVAVELDGSLRADSDVLYGVRWIVWSLCVRSECVEETRRCYRSIPFSITTFC